MLSQLYRYATITYVGGGFGNDGVHNVLEAAVYGKPVVFGPVYEKFMEAVELIDAGAAFSIDNALELEETLAELLKKERNTNCLRRRLIMWRLIPVQQRGYSVIFRKTVF